MHERLVMQDIGRALSIAAIWAGVSGLVYLFNSAGLLGGTGAGFMFLTAFVLTLVVIIE